MSAPNDFTVQLTAKNNGRRIVRLITPNGMLKVELTKFLTMASAVKQLVAALSEDKKH